MPKNESWKRNFPNARPKQEAAKLTETVNIPQPQPKKSGSTCGNPACCMLQARENVTYEGPTVLSFGGLGMGAFSFKGIEPPMLCGGSAWMPKQLSKWERQRRDAKAAPGLSDFKKRPTSK